MKPKIMITLNTAWNLLNFRSGLIKGLLAQGYEVVAVAPSDDYSKRVSDLGCRFCPLAMDNQGTNPVKDFILYLRFILLLLRERPNVYLGYTVKPNIYGSLAARLLGIPTINNVAGLGAVFILESWLTRLVRILYRVALSRSAKVFFQNRDDRDLFISNRLVSATATDLLPGSGIDLAKFSPVPFPQNQRIRFLLIARMLRDKGVGEFVEAAHILKRRGINADFCLLGFLDVQNPTAISRGTMDAWVAEGVVHYLGVTDSVQEEIAQAHCVVLPSYREGTPRTLLEAAAMARPIVTTNAVGCREVVEDGVNGYLCRVQDANDLAEKMAMVIALAPEARETMGRRGREKMEREFNEKIVIEKYLEAIGAIRKTKQQKLTM